MSPSFKKAETNLTLMIILVESVSDIAIELKTAGVWTRSSDYFPEAK